MAQKNRHRLKRALLLGFIGISILLVSMIWADGLIEDQPATPGYYRDSFEMDDNIYLTVTAEAIEFRLTGTPPAADHEAGDGSGSGQGRGHGQGGGQQGDH